MIDMPLLPLVILLTSLSAAPVLFSLPERKAGLRTALNLTVAAIKVMLVILLAWKAVAGRDLRCASDRAAGA